VAGHGEEAEEEEAEVEREGETGAHGGKQGPGSKFRSEACGWRGRGGAGEGNYGKQRTLNF